MHYKIVLLDSFHLERVNGHTLELHVQPGANGRIKTTIHRHRKELHWKVSFNSFILPGALYWI